MGLKGLRPVHSSLSLDNLLLQYPGSHAFCTYVSALAIYISRVGWIPNSLRRLSVTWNEGVFWFEISCSEGPAWACLSYSIILNPATVATFFPAKLSKCRASCGLSFKRLQVIINQLFALLQNLCIGGIEGSGIFTDSLTHFTQWVIYLRGISEVYHYGPLVSNLWKPSMNNLAIRGLLFPSYKSLACITLGKRGKLLTDRNLERSEQPKKVGSNTSGSRNLKPFNLKKTFPLSYVKWCSIVVKSRDVSPSRSGFKS